MLPTSTNSSWTAKGGERALPYLPLDRFRQTGPTGATQSVRHEQAEGFVVAFVGIIIGLLILGASPFTIVDVTWNAIVVQLDKPVPATSPKAGCT